MNCLASCSCALSLKKNFSMIFQWISTKMKIHHDLFKIIPFHYIKKWKSFWTSEVLILLIIQYFFIINILETNYHTFKPLSQLLDYGHWSWSKNHPPLPPNFTVPILFLLENQAAKLNREEQVYQLQSVVTSRPWATHTRHEYGVTISPRCLFPLCECALVCSLSFNWPHSQMNSAWLFERESFLWGCWGKTLSGWCRPLAKDHSNT